MKRNVLKVLSGIMFASLLFFGCPQQPADSVSDKYDPALSNEEVKQSFETALSVVETIPATEEEFNEMMADVIKEMNEAFFSSARFVSPSGDPVSTKDAIKSKLNSIITNIDKAIPTDLTKEINFSIDESINIENATLTDLLDAISEIDILKDMDVSLISPEDDKALINKLIVFNNLYAKAKADVNVDIKKLMAEGKDSSESVGSANIELLASGSLPDFESFIQKMNDSTEKPTLPVKAISAVVSFDANASATYKDAYEVMNMNTRNPSNLELSGASLGYNAEGKITIAICTKSKNGGKLEISPKVSIDKQFIVDYINLQNEYSKKINELWNENLGYETIQTKLQELSEEFQKNQNELFNDVIKINISIGDFSKEYNYSELYSELMKLFA